MWLHQGMNILCKSQSPHLTVNIFTANNSNVSHELNKYRVGLTLRHRGLGQLNRDMSLSNKAGKLQNGHLKQPERKGGLRTDGERKCMIQPYTRRRQHRQNNPTVRKQRGIISLMSTEPLYRLGWSLKCIKSHLSNIIKHYMDPGRFGQKLEYYCTGSNTSERKKCWLQS